MLRDEALYIELGKRYILLAKLRAELRKCSLGSYTPLSRGDDSAICSAGIHGGLQVIKSNCIGMLNAISKGIVLL